MLHLFPMSLSSRNACHIASYPLIHLPVLTPKTSSPYREAGPTATLFIDEETEILIVEWPVGHGHPAAACSAVWESRGSAFRVHSGIDWFCLHGSWQFSARHLLQLDLVFTPPVSRLSSSRVQSLRFWHTFLPQFLSSSFLVISLFGNRPW